MSTTPKKNYSVLGEKFCRLCGSEKDVDRSTNVFSKSGIRKNLAKTISDMLQVSIKKDDGLPSNICRQCEGKLLGFSEFKSSVIDMQSQLRQSVTTKRCKVFSPTLEPDQKVRVVENRSSGRSLTFADHENAKPQSNISSPLLQKNSDLDCPVLTDTLPASTATGNNLRKGPPPLTRKSPDTATAYDPKVSVTTNTPEGGTPATTSTRGNPNPKATVILSQAGLNNPGVSLRKVFTSHLHTLACGRVLKG